MKTSFDRKGIIVISCWTVAGLWLLKLHRNNLKSLKKKMKMTKKQEVKIMETNKETNETQSTETTITDNKSSIGETIGNTVANGTNLVVGGVIVGKDAVVKGASKGKDVVVSGAESGWNWIKDKYSKLRTPREEDQK